MSDSKVGIRIINLREKKNWTQRELARRININVSVMNRIESDERPIKGDELNVIASVLNTTSDYLLGRTDNPNPTDSQFVDEEDEELKEFMKDLTVWYHNEPEAEKDLEVFRRIMQTYNKDKK